MATKPAFRAFSVQATLASVYGLAVGAAQQNRFSGAGLAVPVHCAIWFQQH